MRLKTTVLLIALLALGWSSVAAAEDPASDVVDTKSFSAMSDLNLEVAFEQASAKDMNLSFQAMTGPTTMNCKTGPGVGAVETCVVTAVGMRASAPAALAQR